MEQARLNTFRGGVEACLPTVLGYLGIGIALGVVGANAGFSALELLLMSLIVYAGSAQFVLVSLLVMGTPVSAIIFTIFLINFRHLLMSMSVVPHYRDLSLIKGIMFGSLLTDESYGVLTVELHEKTKPGFAWVQGLNLTAYATWVFATFLGALLGDMIPNPERFGLDYALIAMFAGLFAVSAVDQYQRIKRKTWILIFATVASLFISMRFLSAEISVILATLLGAGLGVILDDR